jgi:crossover junction endonuclease MUS81
VPKKVVLIFCLNHVIQMKRLPVGDALWIARRRGFGTDYVLDFIVERKNVDDLVGSIRDNRYKDQKLRLKVSSELDLNFVIGIKPSC